MAKVVCACVALLLSALPVMAGEPGDGHNVQLTPGQFTVEGGWATDGAMGDPRHRSGLR